MPQPAENTNLSLIAVICTVALLAARVIFGDGDGRDNLRVDRMQTQVSVDDGVDELALQMENNELSSELVRGKGTLRHMAEALATLEARNLELPSLLQVPCPHCLAHGRWVCSEGASVCLSVRGQ